MPKLGLYDRVMLAGARKTIKGKGVLNNQISLLLFLKIENAAGVATHFIERISDR